MADTNTKAGTIGGTIFSFLANIQTADFVKTAYLAAIGAAVSFLVSLVLKWVVVKIRKFFRS